MSDPTGAPSTGAHRWRFFRSGGVDQVRLDTGADLVNLAKLDQKLWVALACPTRGLEFDARTLDLIDTNKDGRIRAPELLAALAWTCAVHNDPGEIIAGPAALSAQSLNPATPEGAQALGSLRRVARDLGKGDTDAITLDNVAVVADRLAKSPFNGDGVITPDACRDADARALVEEIIACIGPTPDRSGKPGISQETLDRFFTGAAEYSAWWARMETDRDALMPLGEATMEAFEAFKAVKPKIEDYFSRRRLAEFDAGAAAALNGQAADFLALGKTALGAEASAAAALPLARIEPGRDLSLKQGVNPAWAAAVTRFDRLVVTPLLGGRDALSPADWAALCARMGAHEAWQSTRPATPAQKLGLDRLRALLGGNGRAALAALVAEDLTHAVDAASILEVERLIRYRRDLHILLMSFVSFRDFYTHRRKALFQVGTLYLDGRSCELCVRVENTDKHAALAVFAKTCLVYCDCTRAATGEKMTIAAAFMDGDSDYLMVGRNGVFYDRNGRDWDATITRIIDNPVSIRQAFWSPYKKVARLIDDQLAKRASADVSAVDAKLGAAASAAVTADKSGKAQEVKRMDVGTVAAIGVALGSIGTFIAAIFTKFVDLGAWLPVGVVVIILAVSLPSMMLAWLKLRQRNLGPMLDANGWAVNTRARINVPFGRTMTKLAALPRDADRSFIDPYAEKRSPWPPVIAAVLVLALAIWALNHFGKLHDWFGIGTPSAAEQPVHAQSAPAERAPAPK
jgi:hypothetical protein